MSLDPATFDIVIVGAGPAGLSFAASLRGSGLRVALVERLAEGALADPPYDGREIALTLKSVRLMRLLGQWERIAEDERTALRGARVQNGAMQEALELRPGPGDPAEFGWMVSNHVIRRVAYAAVHEVGEATLLTGVGVTSVAPAADDATVTLTDGRVLRCRLVVAADSRFSETRRALGIPATCHDFGKTMLVCRMGHELQHGGIACEWFDHRQTLAILPLRGNHCSIVLTLPHAEIERLRALSPDAFAREMETRMGGRLGRVQLASERYAYPLVAVYPKRFVAARYAVIGDAAVGMHPVTAHGFNFGLVGQDTLSALVRNAAASGADIGAQALLAEYETRHRRATRPLFLATNAIVRLFTDDSLPARIARNAMLKIASRAPPVSLLLSGLLMEKIPLPELPPRPRLPNLESLPSLPGLSKLRDLPRPPLPSLSKLLRPRG